MFVFHFLLYKNLIRWFVRIITTIESLSVFILLYRWMWLLQVFTFLNTIITKQLWGLKSLVYTRSHTFIKCLTSRFPYYKYFFMKVDKLCMSILLQNKQTLKYNEGMRWAIIFITLLWTTLCDIFVLLLKVQLKNIE